MKIGDLVKKKLDEMGHPLIGHIAFKDDIGLVIKTDESLSVASRCVLVVWSNRIQQYRCSFLELVNESR